ncbi:MAG TPA: hypothetical protein VME92_05240 [Acetobacteraceae bacterium]|nr:hypothetical protein [Acetobacteraceae bacterium]
MPMSSLCRPRRCTAAVAIAIIATSFSIAAVTPAAALPSLTYDAPVITAAAGSTVALGATLGIPVGDPGLTTDAFGSDGATLVLGQPLDIEGTFFGTPAYLFRQDTQWQAPAQNPLANLSVPSGGSVHLDLGQLVIGADLPAGDYTTDIGVYVQCQLTCVANPFMPPNFADAGLLTIRVTAVPEPSPLVPLALASGTVLLAIRRRSRGSIAMRSPS